MEDIVDEIQDVLDAIDVEHASEAQLRTAVRRISDLVAGEEEDEDEEEEEDEGVEVDEEEDEEDD